MWWKKKVALAGSVLFPGKLPPRAENLARLERQGVTLGRAGEAPGAYWRLRAEHPSWGAVDLVCLRDVPPPPRILIDHSPLSDGERAEALRGHASVTVSMEARDGDVLGDRKRFLRFLGAVMGEDGVIAVDHASHRFWSRSALDDELAHDAALDVDGLFNVHSVASAEGEAPTWFHTHGLDRIGAFDFDVLRPSESLTSSEGWDVVRALAFAVLEGDARISDDPYALAEPGGQVRFVDATAFHRRADRGDASLRELDADHTASRAVACDPAGGAGFFSRLRGDRVRPSTFLSRPLPEPVLVRFSNAATDLMAERARRTYAVFRSLFEEFLEFEFQGLAKIGYRVDGGGPNDREHLWFDVHRLFDDQLEATLLNRPFRVSRFQEGDRGRHAIDLLTDWQIFTPAGAINPRTTAAARLLREKKDEMRRLMREAGTG